MKLTRGGLYGFLGFVLLANLCGLLSEGVLPGVEGVVIGDKALGLTGNNEGINLQVSRSTDTNTFRIGADVPKDLDTPRRIGVFRERKSEFVGGNPENPGRTTEGGVWLTFPGSIRQAPVSTP